MIDDTSARAFAAQQHGLLTIGQLGDLGFGAEARRRLIDGRRWERRAPRVVRLVGAPDTIAQRAMLEVLKGGSGGALGGSSACAWWGIPGNLLEPFEVVRNRGHAGRSARGSGRHEPLLLPDHHVRILEGVPLVTPARALFDVAGSRRRGAELPWWIDRMARMTDAAWSMRLVSGHTLRVMLDELAQRGRPGIRVMRLVLAERPRSYIPPASGVEARFAKVLADAGREPMRRQVDTGDEGGWIGRVDFRDEHLPLIVEIQSERFHTSLSATRDDELRISRLERGGFEVLELTDTDVWHRPSHVITEYDAARVRARNRQRGAA